MPYIEEHVRMTAASLPVTVGELTYSIQRTIDFYLSRTTPEGGFRFQHLAEVLGVLEAVKADIVRRLVNPYEEKKERENGDVWSEKVLGSIGEQPRVRRRRREVPLEMQAHWTTADL